ncbi:MAG: hypothetical protein M3Y86_02255, partial [Verrucomicrobiota bacterium]|nr:hypothetical protein [Verrucomicrobiota bacterium]
TVVRALEESGADFAYSVAVYVPPPGQTERHVSGIFPEPFRAGYALVHSSVIHRKSVFARIGPWPDSRTTQIPGDQLFWQRAAEAGLRFTPVPKLTVWKFNASSRPNCYIEKKADEQARYLEWLRDDPDLAEKELIEVARSAMQHGLRPLTNNRVGRDAPPGAHVHLLRQIRGLEPLPPMEPLPLAAEAQPFRVAIVEEFPATLRAGERFEIEVRIENGSDFELCSNSPAPIYFAYHWRDAEGAIAIFDGLRSPLLPPLPARSTLHYVVTIAAPNESGIYQLEPALIQEGVRWFEEIDGAPRPRVQVRADNGPVVSPAALG